MILHTRLWWVVLPVAAVGVVLCAAPQTKDADSRTPGEEIAELEQKEESLLEKIENGLYDAADLLEERKKLDRTDAVAVKVHVKKSTALAKTLAEHYEKLETGRARQRRLHDRIRLLELQARNKKLTTEVATLQKHVNRVQVLAKRLGDESLKDVKQLEAAAEESRKVDLALAEETIDQVLGMAGKIGALSGPLNKLDLRKFPGPKWKEFRIAVVEVRETAKFFNSGEVKLVIKRFADSKDAIKAAAKIADDPKSAVKVDEAVSNASKLMQWAISEGEHRTKVGRKLESLLKKLPRKEIESLGGLPAMSKLTAASQYLAVGELAIKSWAATGEQILINREVNRINDQIARRDALIKSFSPGGSYHKTYQRDADRLKSARQAKEQSEAEIKRIAGRLAKPEK